LELDRTNEEVKRKINYYNTLNNYLRNSTDYSKLPAPSVAGIEDPNIMNNVAKLIELSVRRSEMVYAVKSKLMLDNIDNEISSVKNVLLENIKAAKSSIQFDYTQIAGKISQAETKIKKLPQDKQEYLKIMRKYDLSNDIYQTYLQKEAKLRL